MKYLLSLLLPAAIASAAQSGPPAHAVTFNHDIAPLVYQHCGPCHHPGGIGPFPLLTYSDVHKHALQIGAVTQRHYMPPWPPEPGYGDFAGSRRLTDSQIRLIADWIKQGQAQGDARDLPAPPRFTSEWQLGPPDLILRMPQPFVMQASGSDVFRNFIVTTGLHETKYVRALELRLDNTRVVHHANVVLDRTQSLRHRDGEDGHPGFPGMDVSTEAAANDFDPDSHFLFWKPGTILRPEPDDMSWRLDPGTDLVLNLHLQSTGKTESVQAEIGLYFSPRPPTRFPMLIQLEHDGAINIPPGDRSFAVTDELRLPTAVNVLAIYPHAHYLGKLVEAWATLPDGTRKWLIRIPDWDINWQAVYEYRRPVFLPQGTSVAMRITYDNSTENPRNPCNPPQRVTSGNLSTDEMGHLWLQVLPATTNTASTQDTRYPLQEAVMRRRLEKYPGDFLAHYNLAALEQSRGKLGDAIPLYRDALRIEPQNATAHNSLGSALLLEDDVTTAIAEFRTALAAEPSYINARYNLAHALALSGDFPQAAAEYQRFLTAKPDDAGAQAALGTIYFKLGRYPDALACFREAARLNPKDADIQANLGTLLVFSGDLPAAVQAYERALAINPDHQAARANLERARAAMAAKPN
ncbi:MAG: tetratricopeptide repeat protein [Acidobacteriaceae bacterium]|nr:tetratricopeptide repeat protein [Acidobacteriaceae bacterium]